MKGHFIFLFALFLSIDVLGQNMDVLQVDKLNLALSSAKDDSTRALVLTQLAEAYRDRSTDTSFHYGQLALDLSRRIEFPRGQSKSLLALSYYFFNRGDLTKALELGLKALDIAQKYELRYDQAFAMIRLGNVYMGLKEYKEALAYYQKTRVLTENSVDSFFYVVSFWRAADAYAKLNMMDSSLAYAKKAEEKAILIGNSFILRGIAPIMGNTYAKMGNDSLALRYLRLSQGGLSSLNLALFFKDRGLNDSALFYANRAYQSSLANKIKQLELESAIILSTLYEASDPEKAIRFYKVVLAAKDSLYGAEKVSAAKTVAFAEKERENEMLVAEMSYRNKIKIISTLAGLVFVFLIALILFISNRKRKKANALLQKQKNDITQALADLKKTQAQLVQSEKMASLGELTAGIAHEIQNPLNFVNNFSEINADLSDEILEALSRGDLEQVKTIATDIKNNGEKITEHGKRADAIVKSMLQHSRISSGAKEPTDINKLADEYLRLAYHGFRAKDKTFNATIHTDFDAAIGKIPIMPQDIGRVLLNLINNSFYAVSEKQKLSIEGYEPMVSVHTKKINGEVEISVADNGNGIPEKVLDKVFQPFFTTKPTGQGTGLGLSLSYDIIKAQQGKINIKNTPGKGAEFIITLPINA